MKPSVTYTHSRLCFKAKAIEPLNDLESFQINSKAGSFIMTKGQFYSVFSNVVVSRSYREKGIYHYPSPPSKSNQFRVRWWAVGVIGNKIVRDIGNTLFTFYTAIFIVISHVSFSRIRTPLNDGIFNPTKELNLSRQPLYIPWWGRALVVWLLKRQGGI